MKSVMFDRYEVFENGTIINTLTGLSMTQQIKGHRREVRLTIDGKRKNFITSRLVYWLFNEDFDISNKNLCIWGEDMINFTVQDLKVVHRKDLIQGEKHKHQAKLTNAQAEEIRELYQGKPCTNQYDKHGISYQDIADKYGVTKGLIAQIIKGSTRNEDKYILK